MGLETELTNISPEEERFNLTCITASASTFMAGVSYGVIRVVDRLYEVDPDKYGDFIHREFPKLALAGLGITAAISIYKAIKMYVGSKHKQYEENHTSIE